MTEGKQEPNMHELQDIARCLNSLLYDPHPGLITWRQALDAQLVAISPFCPLSTREESLVKALEAIIRDLPAKRDWLDPVVEAQARAALTAAKGGKG